MNHRELILSARKKARFAFLSLPEALQDEIIDGLDGQTLTLMEASALVKERGHSLSHEAIAGYYRALRLERRLVEVNQELSRIIAELAGKPHEEALSGLINVAIATASAGLIDGTVPIKIDLAKLVAAMSRPKRVEDAPAQDAPETPSVTGLTPQAADEIRRKILGVK